MPLDLPEEAMVARHSVHSYSPDTEKAEVSEQANSEQVWTTQRGRKGGEGRFVWFRIVEAVTNFHSIAQEAAHLVVVNNCSSGVPFDAHPLT